MFDNMCFYCNLLTIKAIKWVILDYCRDPE
jgi:hypothetical protein